MKKYFIIIFITLILFSFIQVAVPAQQAPPAPRTPETSKESAPVLVPNDESIGREKESAPYEQQVDPEERTPETTHESAQKLILKCEDDEEFIDGKCVKKPNNSTSD